MSALSILLALSFLSQTSAQGANPQTSIVIDGMPIQTEFPVVSSNFSLDISTWRGWNYLADVRASTPISAVPSGSGYIVGFDWDTVKAQIAKPKTPVNRCDWHERIVIFTRTEELLKDQFGVLHSVNRNIQSGALLECERSIARLAAWIDAQTDGDLHFVPDVTVEREPMRGSGFGSEFAKRYFGPRINGGGYQAEDKVFRGPYQGAMYVLPGALPIGSGANSLSAGTISSDTAEVNGTPISAIARSILGTPTFPGDLEKRFYDAWLGQVRLRLGKRKLRFPSVPKFAEVHLRIADGPWPEATSTNELSTEAKLSRESEFTEVQGWIDSADQILRQKAILSPLSSVTTATFVSDPERGQVLKISEGGVDRNGGFKFPVRPDGVRLAHASTTPTLSLQIKSLAHDPIGIAIVGSSGRTLRYSLGRAPHLLAESVSAFATQEIAFKNDGTWQTVNLDLRPFSEHLGGEALNDAITEVKVEAGPQISFAGRDQTEPIEFFLGEVKFGDANPSPLLPAVQAISTSDDPEERALFASQSTASSSELITLLSDKSELVRLNACEAFGRIKNAATIPGLTSDVMDLDPAVAGQAVTSLMFQGGDSAVATVRRTIQIGVTENARETAAWQIAQLKEQKYCQDIVLLLADQSWVARLASVLALAEIPGKNSAMMRMAYISQDDPEIKLAVTQAADTTDEYEMRKLLWSAVNEPSDLVRSASDIKLIQSSIPSMQVEGYKGVRDDSRTTRIQVLDYLIQNPSEKHRTALRLAVADRSPTIRSAALRGFAATDLGASSDEISNVWNDRDPDVQLALLDLIVKHKMKLPDQTKALMISSPDERVRKAAGQL